MTDYKTDTSNSDILIVDDNPANIRLLSDILDYHNYLVRGISNPKTALQVAQNYPPDLILLDIGMPQMDGYQVCAQLKSRAETKDIPVIFVSAMGDVSDKVKAFEVGGVDYITKPFKSQEVLARIQTQLKIHKLQAELRLKNSRLHQEITERQHAEVALQHAHDELEQRVQKRTEELHHRNRDLTLLNRVITVSAASRKQKNVLEAVCRELGPALEVPFAAAFVINEDETQAEIAASHLSPEMEPVRHIPIPLKNNPLVEFLLNRKSPLAVEDYRQDPKFALVRTLLQQRNAVSLLLVPFVVQQTVTGALVLLTIQPRNFARHEIELAQSVANQVAGVLNRIQLEKQHKQLEAQYFHAQKMEAIGLLAGGIAHDFNNLLTVINGFAEMAQLQLPHTQPAYEMIESVLNAGNRATSLVRQLLAFSRKQIIQPQILDLNGVVNNLQKMLQRMIGEHIYIETGLDPKLGYIKADPSQIEQIVLNLVVNARDAMSGGGQITIKTGNIQVDDHYASFKIDAQPGPYVLLTVTDTGHGMNAEIQSRIFEPFFTTKDTGQGTGLGLATVYGIVKQQGGAISVYSEEGIGTTFKILFPRIQDAKYADAVLDKGTETPSGTETVLLVEDDVSVRALVKQILQNYGYTVLETANSREAINKFKQHSESIDLLITDVVMPVMGGKALAAHLNSLKPNLKILFMSGYAAATPGKESALDKNDSLLQKPFTAYALATRTRQVLDS